jgi:uncharacterized protein YdcH (DUF465 family)
MASARLGPLPDHSSKVGSERAYVVSLAWVRPWLGMFSCRSRLEGLIVSEEAARLETKTGREELKRLRKEWLHMKDELTAERDAHNKTKVKPSTWRHAVPAQYYSHYHNCMLFCTDLFCQIDMKAFFPVPACEGTCACLHTWRYMDMVQTSGNESQAQMMLQTTRVHTGQYTRCLPDLSFAPAFDMPAG